jgi:pimeloyl-ACP methyl ester carboxylesterase
MSTSAGVAGAPLTPKDGTMLHVLVSHPHRTRVWRTALLIATFLSAAAIAAAPAPANAQSKPTVVLVHGAFADASGWSKVIGHLQRRGYPVIAPANPLRGVSSDAAYLKNVLSQIEGPIVLVGHSYGGFVMTNAAAGNANVKALVYIAAFAPAEGDTVQALTAHAPGSLLGPDTLTIRTFPTPDGQLAPEGYITPSAFRMVFAGDLPKAQTDVMAASQRPAALATLTQPSGPPAWARIPSWYLVAGADKTIGTANLRFMAQRIHATTVEVKGASHVVMMSHPRETTKLILAAAGDR